MDALFKVQLFLPIFLPQDHHLKRVIGDKYILKIRKTLKKGIAEYRLLFSLEACMWNLERKVAQGLN